MKHLLTVPSMRGRGDEMNYKIVEKFVSINGEGKRSGELAVFIRFAGCNLKCSYCDTMWANHPDVSHEIMKKEDIYSYIKGTGVKNITLTGGEPLIQEGIEELIGFLLEDDSLCIEVETNGSIPLDRFRTNHSNRLSFTMDYKGATSLMEGEMLMENFRFLTEHDTVKFVVGNVSDLLKSRELIDRHGLASTCTVFLSPVYGNINTENIVEFMKENKLNGVKLQLQLHKIIWSPEERGV